METLELKIPLDSDLGITGARSPIIYPPAITVSNGEFIRTGNRKVKVNSYDVNHPNKEETPYFGCRAYNNCLLLYRAEGDSVGETNNAEIIGILKIPLFFRSLRVSRRANKILYEHAMRVAKEWQAADKENGLYREIVDDTRRIGKEKRLKP